mmetsp:Transcript_12062/g.30599  ORF Transcript_12062/g.30599 Transcript_12062/m.30599 type:complete len:214 (+) Transcript_12062:1335-1976(+)
MTVGSAAPWPPSAPPPASPLAPSSALPAAPASASEVVGAPRLFLSSLPGLSFFECRGIGGSPADPASPSARCSRWNSAAADSLAPAFSFAWFPVMLLPMNSTLYTNRGPPSSGADSDTSTYTGSATPFLMACSSSTVRFCLHGGLWSWPPLLPALVTGSEPKPFFFLEKGFFLSSFPFSFCAALPQLKLLSLLLQLLLSDDIRDDMSTTTSAF